MKALFLRAGASGFAFFLTFFLLGVSPVLGAQVTAQHDSPHEIRPLRVICWEGGDFSDHGLILQGLAKELDRLGQLKDASLPLPLDNNIEPYWQWLSLHVKGYFHFLADGFYSSHWQQKPREEIKKTIEHRVRQTRDVDLILAFDTWALQDAISLGLDIPILASSVTTFDGSFLAKSLAQNKLNNILIIRETDRVHNLISVFHALLGFKRLGVVFEDSPAGRAMAGVNQIERAAQDRGFTLEICTTSLWGENESSIKNNLVWCHQELARRDVDAVFITSSPMQENNYGMKEVLQPLAEARIPALSYIGRGEVTAGALLGPGSRLQKGVGTLLAQIMVRLALGEKPQDIDTSFVSSPSLALNLRTTLEVGWNPPLSIFTLVDEYVNSDGNWVEETW